MVNDCRPHTLLDLMYRLQIFLLPPAFDMMNRRRKPCGRNREIFALDVVVGRGPIYRYHGSAQRRLTKFYYPATPCDTSLALAVVSFLEDDLPR
jgi:hypothetical protein